MAEAPASRAPHEGVGDDPAQRVGVPGCLEVLEVEGLAQFLRAGVQRAPLRARHPGLGDGHAGWAVGVEDGPPVAVDLVDLVAVEEGVGAGRELGERVLAAERGGAQVAQGLGEVLGERVGDVDAEAVHAPVGPEAQGGAEVGADLVVVPVEVGLLGCEQVQVPLPVGDAFPGAAAEDRLPVGGREFAVRAAAVAEDVAGAGGGAGSGGEGLLEPHVPVRAVVGDQIDDELEPEAVGLGCQRVEVVEGAQAGIDVPVVGDVIAAVGEFARIEGAQPQGVDAEGGEVGEALGDALQVPEAVTVGVGEAAGVDLVDDGLSPPVGVLGGEVGGQAELLAVPCGRKRRTKGNLSTQVEGRTSAMGGVFRSPCGEIVMTVEQSLHSRRLTVFRAEIHDGRTLWRM